MPIVTSSAFSAGGGPRRIDVRPVLTARDRDTFVRVPWPIYERDPVWVPPLLIERKEFIDPRKQPFYQHGFAAQFIATIHGQPVGRISVSDDPRYNALHGTNAGCFGLFESIDDLKVTRALLNEAEQWLRARGRTQLLGPIDYSMNYACGLLVDGFGTPPRVLMNHNPPYYQRLLESCGLVKAKDLYSWWFTDVLKLEEKWLRFAQRMKQRGRVTIRPFNKRDAKAEIERCKQIYNAAWLANWGFVPMTDSEFNDFAKHLFYLVPSELVLLAEVDAQVVGMAMTLPDFNEAMKPLNGRLMRWGLPIGALQLYRNLKRIHVGRLVALGVLDNYRRRGVSELLILQTLINGKALQYHQAELGWTLEDNQLINRAIETVGGERYKTYRIYEKCLG